MEIYIYKLIDPITNEVRYIGKTKKVLKKRLYEHLTIRNLKPKTHKNHWIRSLLSKNLKPKIELLEITDEHTWQLSEQQHIKRFRGSGVNLTNATNGGDGALGCKRSRESIQKILDTKKKRYGELAFKNSEETKRKLSEAMKGKTHSKEQTEYVANLIRSTILQYDLDNNLLNEWHGIRKAADALGIRHTSIIGCLKGRSKTSGGFIWRYAQSHDQKTL
tara:strand:+ start:10312 stop:10968 length:657 start_codon:yes stop_codon:yes gene_type:complete